MPPQVIRSLTTLLAILALFIVGAAALAQQSLTPRPVKDAGRGTICADTGVMRLGDSPVTHKVTSTHTVFSNTDSSGYYTMWGTTAEAVDYAILTRSTASKAVTSYEFSYATATANPGPVTLCNLIYEGYWGNCSALGLGVQATGGFCWSGLPGCVVPPYNGWTFTVFSTTTPLWYQGNDAFLHGMVFFDTLTGPSLRDVGPGNPDPNGQTLFMDSYAPDVSNNTACSSVWFGTYIYNLGSWHLVIDQVDAAASTPANCQWYCGTGTNPDFFTNHVVRAREGIEWQSTLIVSAPHIGAVVAGFLGQATFPIWGQEGLVDVSKPEVMGMPTSFGTHVRITWPVPTNMQYVGYHVYLQGAAFGGGAGITLGCAYDCTVGY